MHCLGFTNMYVRMSQVIYVLDPYCMLYALSPLWVRLPTCLIKRKFISEYSLQELSAMEIRLPPFQDFQACQHPLKWNHYGRNNQ